MASVEDQNMSEVDGETEAMDAEDGTEVNGEAEEASKEESKEDAKDTKKRNKPAVFFMPAIHEFKSDMTRYQLSRSVVIGPIELKELNKKVLSTTLRSTNTIQMGYHRHAETGEYMGYMQMVFGTEEEAADAAVKLEKAYKEPITVKHCLQGSHKEPIKYEDINIAKEYAAESHYKPDNAVAIPDLAEEVTEEDISDVFPNAMIVYIPKYKTEEDSEVKVEETEMKEEVEVKKEEVTENGESEKVEEKKEKDKIKKVKKAKRYAYVCFANAEDATAALDQEFKLHEKEYRVTKLEPLPPVDVIIRSIDAEKLLHFPGTFNQLPNDKKVRIYTLRRQAMHYIRTDYLSEKKLRNLQQRMDVLSQITQQGRRGGYGGKRPGGPGGWNQTPNKRPRNDSFGYSPRGGFAAGGRGGYGGGYGGPGFDAWGYGDFAYGGYGGGFGAYGGGPPRGGRSRGRGGRRW